MKIGAGSRVSLLSCLLCVAVPALAQQNAGPASAPASSTITTLKTTVRRVVLDVVVTDAAGKPVPGLTLSSFAIREDGTPQHPLSFDVHGFDQGMDFTPTKIPDQPPNTFINLPRDPERGPLYVLLYDLVNTDEDDQMYVRQQLVKFIEAKPAGARFAIFVFSDGLHLVQGFTSDQKELFRAIDPQSSRPHVPMVFRLGVQYGRGDAKTMQEVFTHLGRYLDGMAGRKNIVWLAGDFPLTLFASRDEVESYQAKTRQMLDTLARDQISIYPISARGVIDHMENAMASSTSPGANDGFNADSRDPNHTVPEYPLTGAGSKGFTGNISAPNLANDPAAAIEQSRAKAGAGFSSTFSTQATADEVARMTGGRAFYSRNDVQLALAEAVADGSSYYTLSYSPTNLNYNGRLRQIDVSLSRRGYTLSYRRVYYGTDPETHRRQLESSVAAVAEAEPEARQPNDSLSAHMQHGAPTAHQIVFAAHLHPLGRSEQSATPAAQTGEPVRGKHKTAPIKSQRLAIDYAVIARQFGSVGQTEPLGIEVAAAAYDADGRMLSQVVNKTVQEVGAGDAGAQKKLFKLEQLIDVPAGATSVRMAMRDVRTDRIGALEVPLPLALETQASMAH